MLLIVRGLMGQDSENQFMTKAKDVLERFGVRVRELRTAQGYSQEEFAARYRGYTVNAFLERTFLFLGDGYYGSATFRTQTTDDVRSPFE